MRLTETEIVDGLLHPKKLVREVVADYLLGSKRIDPTITRKVIQAVDHFGWKEVFQWPYKVSDFELDEPSMQWVLDQLARTDSEAPGGNQHYHLARMVSRGPVESLNQHLDRILAIPVFHKQFLKSSQNPTPAQSIEQRTQANQQSAEKCWNDLLEHCESIGAVETFAEANIAWCEVLIERILQNPEFAATLQQKINHQLANTDVEFDNASGWIVGTMMIIAGRMCWRSSIGNLYRHYECDWDWFNEEITNSLTQIGSNEVLDYVSDRYLEEPWYVRHYCSSLFQNIHTDAVLNYLPPLLETEQDDGLRGELGVAAASHFDVGGIDIARKIFLESPGDPDRQPIIKRLTAFSYLADFDLPERGQWEQYLDQQWSDFQTRDKLIQSQVGNFPTPTTLGLSQQEFSPNISKTTVYNETVKPGRNQPCPCGSGKKYKKCCLRK